MSPEDAKPEDATAEAAVPQADTPEQEQAAPADEQPTQAALDAAEAKAKEQGYKIKVLNSRSRTLR